MKVRVATIACVVGLLSGCGASTSSSTPTVVPPSKTVMSATTTVAPSAAATPSSSVDHADYPYSLPWPPDELIGQWQLATKAWDGVTRVDHGDRQTDVVQTQDGSLFAFGAPLSLSREDFFMLIARKSVEWHGCDAAPIDREPLSASGADGIVATYHCGASTVLRWLGVHDGFNLAVAMILNPTTDVAAARTRFKERVAQIVWK